LDEGTEASALHDQAPILGEAYLHDLAEAVTAHGNQRVYTHALGKVDKHLNDKHLSGKQ
jgi:hypothetical protein